MILKTLKGFYKNGKYVFMVAGIVYLAIILFLYFLITSSISIMGENLDLLIQDVALIINEYMNGETVISVISEFQSVLDKILQSLSTHLSEFTTVITALIIGLLGLAYIAFEVAKSFAIISIKNESVKNNLVWFILSVAVRTAFSLLFTLLIVWLFFEWVYSILFLGVVYLVLKAVLNIIYIKFDRRKALPLKDAFKIKIILKLILMYLITMVVIGVVAVILISTFDIFVGVLLTVPIVIYLNASTEGVSYELFPKVK